MSVLTTDYELQTRLELGGLIDLGLRLLPLHPNTGRPRIRNWGFGRRRPDGTFAGSSAIGSRERLEPYLAPGLPPKFAIPTGQPLKGGGFTLVLDVDSERGGCDSYLELVSTVGRAPTDTAVANTKTPGCFHLWVLSSSQWHGLPFEVAKGIEAKRAGQYVVVPPTTGYDWQTHPAAVGIAPWPALDRYLETVLNEQELPGVAMKRERAYAPRLDWSSFDDALMAISRAPQGQRADTLLRQGARAARLHTFGLGTTCNEALLAALMEGARDNGLVADDESEARRLIAYIGKTILGTAGSSPRSKERSKDLVRLSDGQAEVLVDVAKRQGWRIDVPADPYSARYGAARTGLKKSAVSDALNALVKAGYLEEGPRVENGGKRRTKTYRLTLAGRERGRRLAAVNDHQGGET